MSKVSADGTMLTHNWDAEPIPNPRVPDAPSLAPVDVARTVPIVAATDKQKKKSRFAAPENKAVIAVTAAPSYYGPTPTPIVTGVALKAAAGIGTVVVDRTALLKRQNRFGEADGAQQKKNKKQKTGSTEVSYALLYNGDANQVAEFDMSKLTVVGSCQKVEKEVLQNFIYSIGHFMIVYHVSSISD